MKDAEGYSTHDASNRAASKLESTTADQRLPSQRRHPLAGGARLHTATGARDTRLERDVAIKVLGGDFAGDDDVRRVATAA